MKNNITFQNLSAFGFSKYWLTADGILYKQKKEMREIKADNLFRIYMVDDDGKQHRTTLKKLYRKVFSKEFCIDEIIDFPGEEWREIDGTDGRSLVSNCGRVKSLCGYYAIILQPDKKENNYMYVKIDNHNKRIHRLVAFSFCENRYKGQYVEIHHKDGNRTNNHADNLEILSVAEHHKRHSKKEKADNEKVLS